MNQLQKIGGVAAITEAGIYVYAFIIYGAVLNYLPSDASAIQRINHLTENQLILSVTHLVIYVLFGIVLAILVLALYERFVKSATLLTKLATVFGFVWVVNIIAGGMIANIGLQTVISKGATTPELALSVWTNVNVIVEGLGGGNEIVGGIWVLLISIAGLKANDLSKLVGYFGVFTGTIGVLTVYPAEIITEVFGVSQIVWFVWIGAVLLKTKE